MIIFLDNNLYIFNEYILSCIGYIIDDISSLLILTMISIGVSLPIVLFSGKKVLDGIKPIILASVVGASNAIANQVINRTLDGKNKGNSGDNSGDNKNNSEGSINNANNNPKSK